MAIGTDDAILKFGTQDQVDDGSTSSIADGAFSVAADVSDWTNDDDALFANAVLEYQFSVAATAGHIGLYLRPINIEGTNDPPVPSADYPHAFVGAFPILFSDTGTNHTFIWRFQVPSLGSSQAFTPYLRNFGTGQTMAANWNLWIRPVSTGPHS